MKYDVCTVGLGYIGLPTSAVMADNGLKVAGVDINENVVETINKGEIHIVEPSLDKIVHDTVSQGNFKAFLEPQKSRVYLVVVPTPFTAKNTPDISYVKSATRSIAPLLEEGDLYIIESTSPAGTTEKMQEYIYHLRPELKGRIHMAYCPERVLPGNVIFELVNNDRVIGGVDEASTQAAIDFYGTFVKGDLHATNAKTAEMCKLVENSSRDVQIAFANELSIISQKAGIDVRELISLANKHPRVNILSPGCGVGGHCIAVDPYFIVSDFPMEAKIIKQARETNNYKAFWCAEQIQMAIENHKKIHNASPKVALMGLAFKPNIDDLRESPAVEIARKVFSENTNIMVVEPNIDKHRDFEIVDIQKAYEEADIIAYLVAHDEFKGRAQGQSALVLDFCGV